MYWLPVYCSVAIIITLDNILCWDPVGNCDVCDLVAFMIWSLIFIICYSVNCDINLFGIYMIALAVEFYKD